MANKRVTLTDIKNMAIESRNRLIADASSASRDTKIYLHWSAGKYGTVFSDYHINITGEGIIYCTVNDLSIVLPHTYKRNSGSIGVSLCCAYNATSRDIGPYPPTAIQIDALAQVGCILADALKIPITKNRIMTHGEAADNEDGLWTHEKYGPKNGCERWDLEYLGTDESPKFNPYATDGTRGGDILRGKMIWYQNLKLSERV